MSDGFFELLLLEKSKVILRLWRNSCLAAEELLVLILSEMIWLDLLHLSSWHS